MKKQEIINHAEYWATEDVENNAKINFNDHYNMEHIKEHFTMWTDSYSNEELELFFKEYKKRYNIKLIIEGIKEYLEYSKFYNLGHLDDEEYNKVLKELDKQEINYKSHGNYYFNEHGISKPVPPDVIYCDQFYIEEPEEH